MSSSFSHNSNLFQIYISDHEEVLPPSLESCRDLFLDQFENYNYHLFGKAALRGFIANNFGSDVLAAYDALIPYAYKADLGRYCLLYAHGGWYADISLRPVIAGKVPLLDDVEIVYFHDYGNGPYQSSYHCQNGFMYVKKGHPLMLALIEAIVRNCRERYFGLTPLAPTGPGLLGELIIRHLGEHTHHGFFMQLTPDHPQKNRAYVGPAGHLMALHKTAWNPMATEGSLRALGASGVNNYAKLWSSRLIYAD